MITDNKKIFTRRKLAAAIFTISSTSVVPIAQAQIAEVVVTATKRAESTQDIPVTVSAIDSETLNQKGIANFEDYLLQLPNVTAGGSGPGQNTIYIRGVASTTPNLGTAGVAGLAPNVALYVDDQPLAQPGRNLDYYAADLARVEVLPGPQGTLYGASSQAGTVRLITNQPDPSGTFANVRFGNSFTHKGEMNTNIEAMLNVPVSDTLTLRGVVFNDSQGGYIDNVAGQVDASQSARFRPEGTIRDNGVPVTDVRAGFQSTADLSDVTFVAADNGTRTEKDINDTVYSGGRISALWDINADWSLTVAHHQQEVESDGVFYADPDLDDLEIQLYEDSSLEDGFHNTNWTLDGRLGNLQAIYTGAYTDREADQFIDYTDYLFVGQYLPYYICDGSVTYPGAGAPSGTCQPPSLFLKSHSNTKAMTHELRFSTDEAHPIRATFGAFYSDLELREKNDYTYPGSTAAIAFNGNVGFGPNFSAPGSSSSQEQWPAGVMFRNDVLRTDEQLGFFGEVTFDFNDALSLTLGARAYDIEVDLKGSAAGSFGNFGADTDNNAGNNLDELFSSPNPDTASTDGVIGKASLTWTPTDNHLLFFTWSEGFRPGLLNRPGGSTNPSGTFTVPYAIDTDDLTNYEIGWKTDLLDNTLRFNGSLFFADIKRLQTTIFDPSITNLFFSDNAADAEILGVEGDFIWTPEAAPGWYITGAFSFLDTEITNVITPTDDVITGSELAYAPEFQANLSARYEWTLDAGLDAHIMPSISYSAESYSDIVTINRDLIDSWVMLGLTAGVSGDSWMAELFVDNLSDERAEIARTFNYDRQRVTYARPRTMGLRVSFDF